MGLLTTTLRLRASGDAPPDVAWQRYADLDLWPTWSPHLRRADTDDGSRRLRPGLTGTVRGPLGVVSARFVVDAVDEPARTWRWTVRRGPLVVRLGHGVSGTPSGSATWLDLHGPVPVVVGYAPLATWALRRLVTPAAG